VVDLRGFLGTILLFREEDSEPEFSFLLFHSVLAAGLAHVDPAILKEAEGDTRDEFREGLLSKVKVSPREVLLGFLYLFSIGIVPNGA
jgi:hypothetical protein